MRVPASRLRVLLVLLGVVVASCSAPPRLPAVPREAENRAVALDNPAIRTWGDEISPEFHAELLSAARRLRAGAEASGSALTPAAMLALSGGGSDGAFGAGLLCGWTLEGSRPEFIVVTGISTGALIAPFAFLGPKHDDALRELYTTVRTRQIAKARPLLSALSSDAMMDTAPLRQKLIDVLDGEMLAEIAEMHRRGRVLVVGTTNLDADRAVIWNIGLIAAVGTPEALQLVRDVLLASASIPAAFPPVMIDVHVDGEPRQEMHVDGATKSQVFLYPPSLQLRAEAAARGADRERVAFVIQNARLARSWEDVPRRTFPIARRAISSLIHANAVGDLLRIYVTARRDGVSFRLASIPESFEEQPAEVFDPVYMNALFDVGFQMASTPGGYPWRNSPPGWVDSGEPAPQPNVLPD